MDKNESADSVMMQELLLGGHLYQKIFKEFLENWMVNLRLNLNKKIQTDMAMQVRQPDMERAGKFSGNLLRTMEFFLATGNLVSKTGLGLMQNSGLVIMAENINRMRYMSHFRAVHRGYYDTNKSFFVVQKHKGKGPVVVDNVKMLGDMTPFAPKKACITTRISRNPSVGDKFASRAGQKGIARRNTRRRTCRSPRAASFPTSSSTPTASRRK